MTAADEIRARARLRGLIDSGRAVRIRKRAGVTQPALAKALDVDAMSVWKWEQGRNLPRDTETVIRWLALLDEMVELMHPEEEEPEAAAVAR